MKNNLIVFDLDGVLVDSKDIHHLSLNKALKEIDDSYVISQKEQDSIYEGLPTKAKLNLLTQYKNLDPTLYDSIWQSKQQYTNAMFAELKLDLELINFFKYIKEKNINIAVASNSIRRTIDQCLRNLGVFDLVDFIISNEDVKNPKPHPEMYWMSMSNFGVLPEETVIFEDSIVGRLAAIDSKATLIEVKNRPDLTKDKIEKAISVLSNSKALWKDSKLNVLIPMAGAGSRFTAAGYSFPKPLIDVMQKPMIQAVVNSLAIDATYTYIVQQEHYEKYNLHYLLNAITPNCNIIQIDKVTEGAAVTTLIAKEFINTDSPLIIANSDQIIDWNSREFLYEMISKNADGGIVTFKSNHPKWSYAKVDSNNIVVEVAEKKPISDNATVGVYYWKHGSEFVKYAEDMIDKGLRVNGEFYVCPVYNEAIDDNKIIYTYTANKMWGIGTPEDLDRYLREHND